MKTSNLYAVEPKKPKTQHSSFDRMDAIACGVHDARIADNDEQYTLHIKKGDSVFISAAAKSYTMEGTAVFYKAAVPV